MGLFDAISGALGAKDDEALAAQQAGAAQAAAIQEKMYNQSREDLSPYMEAGKTALGGMQDAQYMKDFTMDDFQADPGYAFRIAEANKALERSAAAKGGLMGGATLKGLATLNQNLGSQEYQAAYDRFNNNQNQRFGRLSTLAGMGQSSAAGSANNAMNYGAQMGDLYASSGDAQASQLIAAGNRNVGMGMDMIKGASTFAFSDERLKKNIKVLSEEDKAEMRRCVKAVEYVYKNPEHGDGTQFGLLAQDLQKSRIGKTLLREDENGHLMVDVGKAAMMWLASGMEA